jgi:hypothetical protein
VLGKIPVLLDPRSVNQAGPFSPESRHCTPHADQSTHA